MYIYIRVDGIYGVDVDDAGDVGDVKGVGDVM